MKYIRNFCIIAHIDHGKSTLSDRLIEICTLSSNKCNQILDSMELEKEKGITIKASCINLTYKHLDNNIYKFNMIDTPGHIDFSYEVNRAIYACEGAILLIDVTKGVQSQTLSKYRIALSNNLKIITVFNKIDIYDINILNLIEETKKHLKFNNYLLCSAKTGQGINILLEHIIKYIPAPTGNILLPLQALIIDSWFDDYLGVICLIRIKNGIIKKYDKIKLMTSKNVYIVAKLGYFIPYRIELNELKCGEIGWLILSGIQKLTVIPVGDTITLYENTAKHVLPTFNKSKSIIYASLYPLNKNDYEYFKKVLFKLSFNDAALQYEMQFSSTFGLGFKCGFLGLLHIEIIKERLKREYKLEIFITAPSVDYQIVFKNNETIEICSPSQLKNIYLIKEIREPIAICDILIDKLYINQLIKFCINKRGIQKKITYSNNIVYLTYEIPLSEIITDFYQQLQSLSKGYASLDYTFIKYNKSQIVILNLLINKKIIEEFQLFIHFKQAKKYATNLVEKMKEYIPRQQSEIIIQASINNKIICSGIIKPLRKNVIAKCYGGDVTRKKKLLTKQKIGKNKIKHIGKITIPQKAFLAIFNLDKYL